MQTSKLRELWQSVPSEKFSPLVPPEKLPSLYHTASLSSRTRFSDKMLAIGGKKNYPGQKTVWVSMFDPFRSWNPDQPLFEKGYIVASDLSQEWLLSWWWENYRRYNTLPVAFVDLGMSKEGKEFCKEKGIYTRLLLPDLFVPGKEEFEEDRANRWEEAHGKHFWKNRGAWFKKPSACLTSPFALSVWIDLDCEVKADITDIFSLPLPESGFALAGDYHSEAPVNSGVILFRKGSEVIRVWAEEALDNNRSYVGDQDILYDLIREERFVPGHLPLTYNRSRFLEPDPEARVVHWHGDYGKSVIEHQIRRETLQEQGLF